MTVVIPAILTNDQKEFSRKLTLTSSLVNTIQVDCINMGWCPNTTLRPEQWGQIPEHTILESHLMVDNPMDWISPCKKAGCLMIVPQIESISNQQNFIDNAYDQGLRIGFAINIDTPIESINQASYGQINQILLLSVRAGYSGQGFDIRVLPKIKTARQLLPKSVSVGVDGGINLESGRLCIQAGADTLVVNSFLWPDFKTNLKLLQAI